MNDENGSSSSSYSIRSMFSYVSLRANMSSSLSHSISIYLPCPFLPSPLPVISILFPFSPRTPIFLSSDPYPQEFPIFFLTLAIYLHVSPLIHLPLNGPDFPANSSRFSSLMFPTCQGKLLQRSSLRVSNFRCK